MLLECNICVIFLHGARMTVCRLSVSHDPRQIPEVHKLNLKLNTGGPESV